MSRSVSGVTTALICLAAIATAGGAAPPRTVKTETGLVSGASRADGVTAYLGIPYAAPPVGDLRWKPPQPASKWSGVRPAEEFGTSCMQAQPRSHLPWTEEFMTQGPIGEDCLFLNVWTPAKTAAARLPVMLWIYGGAFNEGSGAIAVYDGEGLAKKGVIVVNVNYRVGPIGFLSHPELTKESEHHSSGNYGLLDQIAGLQWVQRNIAAFGGDPRRVTVFGQSAGAMSVIDLMQSPLAAGLFARAIAQSGPGLIPASVLGSSALSDREAIGARYAESKGARTLAELRALPAPVFYAQAPGSSSPQPPRGPVIDGWVIPGTLPDKQVPLVIGFVADDIAVGVGGFGATPAATASAYDGEVRRVFGDKAETFLKLYPAQADADVAAAQKTAGRDRTRVSMGLWARDQATRSGTVYTYYFDRVLPWPAHPEFGAFHSSELPYVFRTLDRFDRPWLDVDRQLSETVSSYWTNFAKSGDPNGASLPKWPSNSFGTHSTMQLGERVGTMDEAAPGKLDFWTEQLKK